MITLITPTRNRARCFSLLTQYLRNQTIPLAQCQWLVVCDGNAAAYSFPQEATVILREPSDQDPFPSLNMNLLEAVPRIQGTKIIFAEDDEVYFPTWLETMGGWLDEYPLVGEGQARYYNLSWRRYMTPKNTTHASLCQSGFRPEVLPYFIDCCKHACPFIDDRLWEWQGSKRVYPCHELVVSMKGLWADPPMKGYGKGHEVQVGTLDRDKQQLKTWLREYAGNYL